MAEGDAEDSVGGGCAVAMSVEMGKGIGDTVEDAVKCTLEAGGESNVE